MRTPHFIDVAQGYVKVYHIQMYRPYGVRKTAMRFLLHVSELTFIVLCKTIPEPVEGIGVARGLQWVHVHPQGGKIFFRPNLQENV